MTKPSLFDCPKLAVELNQYSWTVESFLKNLPAADLHIHGGAMCPADLAVNVAWQRSQEKDQKLQKTFGNQETLLDKLNHPKPGSLEDYLFLYHSVRDYLFTTLEDIKFISRESGLYAYQNGTNLFEVRTSIKSGEVGDPASRHTMENVNFTPYEEFCAMIDGFEEAIKLTQNKLHVYLIISLRRGDTLEKTMTILDEAISLKKKIKEKYGVDYIRGLDIAGKEYGDKNKAKLFRDIFIKAKQHGFFTTAHAGEDVGVGEGSILHALNHLEVHRIGHGSTLYRPSPLLEEKWIHKKDGKIKNAFTLLLRNAVPLEMCLSSNIIAAAQFTKGYTDSLKQNQDTKNHKIKPLLATITKPTDYPFEILMALGDLVPHGKNEILPLVCTDGIFTLNTSLAREFSQAAQAFDLGIFEILALAYYSIQHSFAPQSVKDDLIEKEWLPFAKNFMSNQDPLLEMRKKLANYRKKMREKLEINDEQVEKIGKEIVGAHGMRPKFE